MIKEDFSNVFIAVYTNECKNYCDKQFFNNLIESNLKKAQFEVADNSLGMNYSLNLQNILGDKAKLHHISVDRNDKKTLFHRNVTESVMYLRSQFLASKCDYFVILESDIIVPHNFLELFNEVISEADIIGGLYYQGFHTKEMWESNELIPTLHVLSGCTLYKRALIEKIPFRWSKDCLGAFPDALISYDANQTGEYKLANYCKIKCVHLEKPGSCTRGQESLV